MIDILHRKNNISDMVTVFNKLSESTMKVNKELLAKDIERMSNEIGATKNRVDNANVKAIVKYLEKMLRNTDEESNLEMCWSIGNDGLPYSYPIPLVSEPLYKIYTTNYIEVPESSKLINIDLTNLADLMAYEFMFRDLGEDHESIEELLDSCGILSYENSNILLDKFKEDGDHVFDLSKSMLIGDTPYYCHDTRTVADYFGYRNFNAKGRTSYHEVVDYSCRCANCLIAYHIIKECNAKNKSFKLIGINATTIAIIIDADADSAHKLIDQISIQIFGRRFLVEPTIHIY